MSTTVSEPTQTEDALALGLTTMDASRRVGWAKAFAALARVEALEEEIRLLRDEQRALRRAYSRLVGLVQHLPIRRTAELNVEVAAHYAAERTFRHDDAWQQGVALARDYQAAVQQWTELDFQKRALVKKTRQKAVAKLRADSRALGHRVKRTAIAGGQFDAVCSCGEQSRLDTYPRAIAWTRNHDSLVVHGVPYRQFRANAKRAAKHAVKEAS